MSCLRIYQDNYIDATIVSNRFIDEYMAEANDAQLKIYLYLLRMMNAGRTFSISGIAHFRSWRGSKKIWNSNLCHGRDH